MTTLTLSPTTRFPVPDDSTAPAPAEYRGLTRDRVRLLVADPDSLTHSEFRDLHRFLRPGDLVVVNASATLPGELDATSERHGAVVLHVGGRWPGAEDGWVLEVRTSPGGEHPVLDARPGDRLHAAGLILTLQEPYRPAHGGVRLWRGSADGDLRAALSRHGRAISYGYLDRPYPLGAYQTIFASIPGSAEMASAARPFTPELVTALVAGGVLLAPVLLHTGLSSQESGETPMSEWFEVSTTTAALVNHVRRRGGRVIAAGTTATRALESAADDHGVHPSAGWTDRVVSPADPPRVVDGLITGWHNPDASHLLLVEAVAGAQVAQRAYDAATEHGYLWHEFGDSGLLLRA